MTLAGPEDAVDLTFSVANHVECLPIANNFQGVFPIGPSVSRILVFFRVAWL